MLQLPELQQEQAPNSHDEAARLTELAQLVATATPLPDVHDLAPAVRRLFPKPSYRVGCGGSHIWLHRTDDNDRLACILDHHQ